MYVTMNNWKILIDYKEEICKMRDDYFKSMFERGSEDPCMESSLAQAYARCKDEEIVLSKELKEEHPQLQERSNNVDYWWDLRKWL